MTFPFGLFHHYPNRCQCFGDYKAARNAPIVKTSRGRSWYTVPGKMLKFARPVDFPEDIFDPAVFQSVTYQIFEAQEFKTVWYTWEREDLFNRKSGRYEGSTVYRTFDDGRTEPSWERHESVKDLSPAEVLESQP